MGGWDSHNVAEDADLGIRLYRNGFRVETIDVPTFEDAPERWLVWRNQRTRWMKGWMQTWLVHMRNPFRLGREMGTKGFFAFQMLFFGMLASSVAHAFLLVMLTSTIVSIWLTGWPDMITCALLAADTFNLVTGYIAFIILSTTALDADERRSLPRRLWTLTAYWLLVSTAAFRAFGQLFGKPHAWEKTPHGPSAVAAFAPTSPGGKAEAAGKPALPSLMPRPNTAMYPVRRIPVAGNASADKADMTFAPPVPAFRIKAISPPANGKPNGTRP